MEERNTKSLIQNVNSNPGVAQHTGEEPGTGEGAKEEPKAEAKVK